jgi:hypothetical protein
MDCPTYSTRTAAARRNHTSDAQFLTVSKTASVRAELFGSDGCSAVGITVSATSPVLALCRRLIAAGYDPGLPLEAWRGSVLCLRVRSIGEAAQLRVATHGGGFEHLRGCAAGCTAASPVRETAARLCPTTGRPERASEADVP